MLFRVVDLDAAGNLAAAGPTATYTYTVQPATYLELYTSLPASVQQKFPPLVPTALAGGRTYTGGGGPSVGPPPPSQ